MAVPKRRTSVSKRNKRRAHDSLTAPTLVPCPQCGEPRVRHRACAAMRGCRQESGSRRPRQRATPWSSRPWDKIKHVCSTLMTTLSDSFPYLHRVSTYASTRRYQIEWVGGRPHQPCCWAKSESIANTKNVVLARF